MSIYFHSSRQRSRKPTHAGDPPSRYLALRGNLTSTSTLCEPNQPAAIAVFRRKGCITISSPHALSCSANNDEGLSKVTRRILSSLSSSIPAASANETSARSRVNRIPSLRACRSQTLLSSSTQRPVNRPSTLSLTAAIDDSTTVTFIPHHSRPGISSWTASYKSRIATRGTAGQGLLPGALLRAQPTLRKKSPRLGESMSYEDLALPFKRLRSRVATRRFPLRERSTNGHGDHRIW